MTINTNYKISNITLNNLHAAILRLGFDDAFEIALQKSIGEIRENPESIMITEYLSWSHHLSKQAACITNLATKSMYHDAAAFYRKLAHHTYWIARKENLVEYNAHFIQAA